MRAFARLWGSVEDSGRTAVRIDAIRSYFAEAPPEDAAWALSLLLGRMPKRTYSPAQLMETARAASGLPEWLVEKSLKSVEDVVETASLIAPEATSEEPALHQWMERPGAVDLEADWRCLGPEARLLWNRFLTGTLKTPVSEEVVIEALHRLSGVPPSHLVDRLKHHGAPTPEWYKEVITPWNHPPDQGYGLPPVPPLKTPLHELGEPGAWVVEGKPLGIDVLIAKRQGVVSIGNGEATFLNLRFPEIAAAALALPDGTVLRATLVGWQSGPLPERELRRRLSGVRLTRRVQTECPVIAVVNDVLEANGKDLRKRPLRQRLDALEALGLVAPFQLRPPLVVTGWEEIDAAYGQAMAHFGGGLVFRCLDAAYGKGVFEWVREERVFHAVLMYAQFDSPQVASLYTYGVWHEGEPISVAKVSEGLGAEDKRILDLHIRNNTTEKVGPIRVILPELVMELTYEGIDLSKRHKAGLVLRNARVKSWRRDLKPEEAHSLTDLRRLCNHED